MTTVTKTDEEVEKERLQQEKEEKEAREKAEQLPARGRFCGGIVRINPLVGEAPQVSETYIGIGPLAVPCTRGEQKALSGDVIVLVYADLNGDGVDEEFIFLLPSSLPLPGQPVSAGVEKDKGITAKEYADFLQARSDEKAEQKAKAESTASSAPLTSKVAQGDISKRPVGGVDRPSQLPANPPIPRPRTS